LTASRTAPRSEGGAAAPAAGSFTIEQVDRLRNHGRLRVLRTVEDGHSLCDENRHGVYWSPMSGVVSEAERVASVPFGTAAMRLGVKCEDLWPLWDITCPKGACPGRVLDLVELLLQRGETIADAWAGGWTVDAMQSQEKTALCGSTTREVVSTGKDGALNVSLSRARCGSARCPHCSVGIVGAGWRSRLRLQAAADEAAGRPWSMLTLTLDPGAWCEARGLPLDVTSAVLAQRWIGRAWAALARKIKGAFGPTESLRVMELHGSGWPHLHVLLRGKVCAALLDEAAAAGRGEDWEAVSAWAKRQTELQRVGRLRVARAPAPVLRRELGRLATACGFGLRLHLAPIPGADRLRVADYMVKGLEANGPAKRLPDVAPLVAEVTKSRQRAGLLARGARVFADSGFLSDAPRPERDSEGVVDVRVWSVPLDRMRAEMEDAGAIISGVCIRVDFSGPIPDAGEKRPRDVESVASDVSPVELLRELCGLPPPVFQD